MVNDLFEDQVQSSVSKGQRNASVRHEQLPPLHATHLKNYFIDGLERNVQRLRVLANLEEFGNRIS